MPYRNALFLLAILACAAGCEAPDKPHTPAAALHAGRMPAQESWGQTLTVSNNGVETARIVAGHASEYHEEGRKEIVVDGGIRVVISAKDGGPPTVMTAGRGKVHDNNDIEAFDKVVIMTGDGTQIRTDYIMRTAVDRMLRSDRFVTINRPDQTIQGKGFESDEAMKRYRIFQASGEAVSK